MNKSAEPFQPKQDKFYQFKPFRVPKYQVKFERARQLDDVQGYVWYSPAMLYLWGRYSETNLADLVQRDNLQVFWYRFDKPIFQGFECQGNPGWNHILWAAREDQWRRLVDGILETVQFDIPRARLYQYAMQSLTVYDPLAVDIARVVSPKTPTRDIHVFAVLSNERQFAFDVRNRQLAVRPRAVSFKPQPVHVEAAQRLFRDKKLDQDKAFERYKEIMLSLQDAETRTRQQQLEKQAKSSGATRGRRTQ